MGADEAPRGGLEGEVVAPGGRGGLGGEGEVRLHRGRSGHVHRLGERPTPWRAPSRLRSTAPWNPP